MLENNNYNIAWEKGFLSEELNLLNISYYYPYITNQTKLIIGDDGSIYHASLARDTRLSNETTLSYPECHGLFIQKIDPDNGDLIFESSIYSEETGIQSTANAVNRWENIWYTNNTITLMPYDIQSITINADNNIFVSGRTIAGANINGQNKISKPNGNYDTSDIHINHMSDYFYIASFNSNGQINWVRTEGEGQLFDGFQSINGYSSLNINDDGNTDMLISHNNWGGRYTSIKNFTFNSSGDYTTKNLLPVSEHDFGTVLSVNNESSNIVVDRSNTDNLNTIYEINPEGGIEWEYTLPSALSEDIIIASNGNILFSNPSNSGYISPSGELVDYFPSEVSWRPYLGEIEYSEDQDGNFYILKNIYQSGYVAPGRGASWNASSIDYLNINEKTISNIITSSENKITDLDFNNLDNSLYITYYNYHGSSEVLSQSLQSIAKINRNDGIAAFSLIGRAEVSQTLSITEDTADPDGTGDLTYSWQRPYSDNSGWFVVGTSSTYDVAANDEGTSIRAVISYTDDQGFAEEVTTTNLIYVSHKLDVSTHQSGTSYSLEYIRDYDGNLHANTGSVSDATKSAYKYQGLLDVNKDGIKEAIYTNKESGRWVTASVDSVTGKIDYSDHGSGGTTRVVGIYIDPLVTSGEVEQFGPHDSQRRFQNDLKIDNLIAKTAGDYDGDGFQEVYWKTNDGTAYLRALMHADGNIQYANYQSEVQMTAYLTNYGHSSVVSEIV